MNSSEVLQKYYYDSVEWTLKGFILNPSLLATTTVVPEPSTGALLALGAILFLSRRHNVMTVTA